MSDTTEVRAGGPAEGPDHTGASARKPDRRAALIHAALELFSNRPYEEVSVGEICARAGVAHGLLSYHFGGKRNVFAAAVECAWDELIAFEKPKETEVTVVERFRGYLARHFSYFRLHPERFRMMTRSDHADADLAMTLREVRRKAVREIEASLGCPDGAPRKLRMAISGWASFVDSVTVDYIEDPLIDTEGITDMCAQVLVAAVRSACDIRINAAIELEAISKVAALPPADRSLQGAFSDHHLNESESGHDSTQHQPSDRT